MVRGQLHGGIDLPQGAICAFASKLANFVEVLALMFRSILIPIDIAHRSSWQFALPQAIELAAAGKAKLTVTTVVRELNAMFEGVRLEFQLERLISDAREKLAQIVAEFDAHGIVLEQSVLFGSIGAQIRRAATEVGADLIVMASHRPEMRDYLIGPNAGYVAQNATCSVLVLRRFE